MDQSTSKLRASLGVGKGVGHGSVARDGRSIAAARRSPVRQKLAAARRV